MRSILLALFMGLSHDTEPLALRVQERKAQDYDPDAYQGRDLNEFVLGSLFEEPDKLIHDKSDELLFEVENECPITGLPYSTPEMMRELGRLGQEAISQGKVLLFYQADIDKMKKMNDDLGDHLATNHAIQLYFNTVRQTFSQNSDITCAM